MTYKTIYEAQRSYDSISPTFIIVTIASIVLIVLMIKDWKNQRIVSKIGMTVVILTLSIIFISMVYSFISSQVLVYNKYAKGKYSVAEGTIENYTQKADHPPADFFDVSNIDFEVPGFTNWGYALRQRDGGVLKDGVQVRICYIHYKFENVIMKLELLESK